MSSLWTMAGTLVQGFWRKASAWGRSSRWTAGRHPLYFQGDTADEIRTIFEERMRTGDGYEKRSGENGTDEDLTGQIRRETEVWNLNNVTRTQAYWNVYAEFPELHWALLAHMVSRNGGWCMTDLKGEWLPHLLTPAEAGHHFELLETCNALIFRDAYPQLRLYAQSRRSNAPLFRLLPRFGVSSFMLPFWERFWRDGQSVLLTVALIVNEQHVIQKPVVENRYFRDRVLDTRTFRSLPLLQTNQIVFPLFPQGRRPKHLAPLAGRVLESFASLEERIGFGKGLYGMLFGYPRVLAGVEAYTAQVAHTGSRADYWPERFHARQNKTGGQSPQKGLSAGNGWYSPTLERAWPDRPLPVSPVRDWFTDLSSLSFVSAPKAPRVIDMTYEHLLCLRKWQTAAVLQSGGEA